MYSEKMEQILLDLENKDIEIAGGSVVGIVLGTVNSLIKYISNLTIGKKRYEEVQDKVEYILEKADKLKKETIEVIDKDREILEEILKAYKTRKEEEEKYEQICKKSVEFCMNVVQMAYKTLELSEEISEVGNKMLSSDFKICKYYAYASIQSAIVNIDINIQSVKDEEFKEDIVEQYNNILDKAKNIMKNI